MFWGEPYVVAQGTLYDTRQLEALIAVRQQEIWGILHYRIDQSTCEIITLASLKPGQGIGSALVNAVEARARSAGCKKLRLITTNDNLNALRFYQKRGYCLSAVFPGQLATSRKMKPSIPEIGEKGIPLRDELLLEKNLP